MIIRKVIVVINQRAFICIFLNRFSKWIGYFFFIVRECRYKCTCLSNEALSFIGISKPCKEVLSCLTLLITCCIRGIDHHEFGTSTNKLLIGSVICVLRYRHHSHILCIIICIDYGPVPVSSEHECDLSFSKHHLGCLTLCSDCRIFCVIILHHYIEEVHKRIEFLIVCKVCCSFIKRGNKCFYIWLLLVNLSKEVSCKGPVLFHDTGRCFHSAFFQFLKKLFKRIKCLVIIRIEGLACDCFDCICIVNNTACFKAGRETIDLSVNSDCVISLINPALIA